MAEDAGPFHCRRPDPPLAEFVDFLWIYEGYVQPHARERLLPTGTMELVFNRDGDGRLASGVAGARSEFLVLDTSRPLSVIGVHFRPGGGFPFFGVPSGELHNRTLALDALWGADAPRVRDQLWEAGTPAQQFDILERALLRRARGRWDRHPGVSYALRAFDRSPAALPVAEVVGRIGMSSHHDFRAFSGINPSTYLRHRIARTHVAVTD
jgi:uncharacterized protein DUF6597